MFYLFSTSREQKNFGKAVLRMCAECQITGSLSLVLTRYWLSLFFVRLFVYSDVWSLKCPSCCHDEEVRGRELAEAKDRVRAGRTVANSKRVAVAL